MKSLPKDFIEFLALHPEFDGLQEALSSKPEVTIRLNTDKTNHTVLSHQEKVSWCDKGFYLPDRPQFTFDPEFHQGHYYVQDASSMAIYAIVNELTDGKPIRYLDACAAPGGKTTTVISALPKGSIVVANEFDFKRAEVLAENIAKWGCPNILVSRGNTVRFKKLKNVFDIVAVDAPCSGEGMMRKDEQAIAQWSPSLIKQCAETQRQILENVWNSLRPGGYLIYSTCTFNTAENEENLQWIIDHLGAEPVKINALESIPDIVKGINSELPVYRFIPGKIRGEGLFIGVIRKFGNESSTVFSYKEKKTSSELRDCDKWIVGENDLLRIGDEIYAFPKYLSPFIHNLMPKLDMIQVGTHIATVKGKDIIPTHTLVLSSIFNRKVFPLIELNYAQAIKYLQREAITLPDDTPKGYVTLSYNDSPLGLVKNLGNRCNNLLPKDWRILSKNIPDTPPSVLT